MKMKDKGIKDAEAKTAHQLLRKAAKERHRIAPNLERQAPVKNGRSRILIYCEGRNTEPSYFNQFNLANLDVRCYGEGRNTLSLVRHAILLREQAKERGKAYDKIWCVFDRDPKTTNKSGHTAQNFNAAIRLAEEQNIGTAYSNQAFEYWLILHFNDHQGGPMSRSEYNKLINKHLSQFNCVYDGNRSKNITKDIFDILEAKDIKLKKSRRIVATERARNIFDKLPHDNPAKEESSTTVFQLVSYLTEEI